MEESEEIILGDSRVRNITKELQSMVDKNYKVLKYVYPGAHIPYLAGKMQGIGKDLTHDDVLIFFEGSNDAKPIKTTH